MRELRDEPPDEKKVSLTACHRKCGLCDHKMVAIVRHVKDEPTECEKCGGKTFVRSTYHSVDAAPKFRRKVNLYDDRELDAFAVHPSQVAEAMARDKALGVPTEYVKEPGPYGFCRPKMRSPEHEKRYLKAQKYYNRDSY